VAASGGVDAGKLLRILHVDPERNWGGGEAQVFGLLSFLVSKGHSNDILTHPAGQLYAEVAKLKVGRFPLSARNDLDLRAVCSIRRRIKERNYDIVHLHTKRAHALSLWLNRGKKLPKYVVTRRMDYVEKNNWYTRCLYNRRVDGVVAISQNILDGLVNAGVERRKIRLIYSGIDHTRFVTCDRTDSRKDNVTVGCLAVLESRKGIGFLLDAAWHLQSQGVRVNWLIGGTGSRREELQNKASALGLAESVTFLGFVAKPEEFLRHVDIFVMPSLFEGLGVAALEAMAAGKPIVATKVGGLAESVVDGQTGLLVVPANGKAIADAIGKLVAEPEVAREMGVRGRQRVVENFTMTRMAAQNEAYYYDLLVSTN
jgi:glycosyltransferase involved in cell wall biosynthesis